MSLNNLILRNSRQMAVYWGNPVSDGYGGYTFDTAVEIQCRWEEKKEVILDFQGDEIISTASIFVNQDVDEQGYLYLGELDDLDSDHSDPKEIEETFIIKKFNKIPGLNGGHTRVVYL